MKYSFEVFEKSPYEGQCEVGATRDVTSALFLAKSHCKRFFIPTYVADLSTGEIVAGFQSTPDGDVVFDVGEPEVKVAILI